MTTELILTGIAGSCPARRHRIWRNAIVLVAAAVWGFIAGQIAQRMRDETAIYEEGQRQFQEFLGIATDLGIITVDRQRLDELVCIVGEAAWKDDPPCISDGVREDRP